MNQHLLRFQVGWKKSISIKDVLEFVNQNIKGKDEFYDILLKIRNQWTNVLEVFRQNLQISIDSQQLDIKIINNDLQLEDYEIKLSKCNQELEVLKNGIKKDIQEIEKDKAIDIAFFYSQPLMKYGIKNTILPNDQQQVGYLEQLRKLENKIKNELSIKGTNRFNMRRSTKIQIHVLTLQNLEKVLEKGVKFLHFATHGQKNYFKIESSSQIGLADKLNYPDLIKMIKKKPPQLIVFNVCLSHDIAQTIYNQFQKQRQRQNYKPIITIGYDYKVDNVECEYISQILYTEILKGEEFKKIEQYLFEELRKIKQKINIQRRKNKKSDLRFEPSIFFNKFHEIILFKPLKIKQIHKVVEIQKNISFVKNQLKSEEKKLLYAFMKKILQEYQGAVNCFGELTSNFIQKCLSYLWERNRLENKLIFDCKQLEYEITNILQFRCKFMVELQRSNIMERKKETFVSSNLNKIKKPKIIVIKNCDKLLKYQIREFGNILSFFMKKFAPNILIVTSKQDFTKKITYNVQFTSFNAELKNTNPTTLISSLEHQSLFQSGDIEKKSFQFENSYLAYLKKFVKKANKQFISRIPLVNLFPSSLFQKQIKSDQKMEQNLLKLEQNYSAAILYAQHKMRLLIVQVEKLEKLEKERKQKKQQKKMNNDRLEENTNLINIYADQIIDKIHCIGGFLFLYFEYLGQKEKQYHQPKIRRSVYRLINLCLQIRLIRKRKHPNEQKTKSQQIVKEQKSYEFFPDPIFQDFYQFQIKMYQMVYLLHIESQFQSSEQVIAEIKDCLKKFDEKIVAQRAYTMKQMQKIWTYCRKLHQDIKKKKEISFFKNKRHQDYFEQINSLKDSIEKSIESKNSLSQWGLFSIQDVNFMLFPILSILKEEVMKQSMSESIFNDCSRVEKLESLLQKFEFLEKIDQGVFEAINKQYSLMYIQAKMKLQRLKHRHKEYFQITGAIYSREKFNKWIQMCQYYKLNQLKIYLNQEQCRAFTPQQSADSTW